MQLPGGIYQSGKLYKDFSFRQFNGELELVLAEHDPTLTIPEQISQALFQALDHIAGNNLHYHHIANLCVGDRQFLLLQIALALDLDMQWLNANCGYCADSFDFKVQLSQLPLKKAGNSYPFIEVNTSQGKLVFRLPNGADQVIIAKINDPKKAQKKLLRLCFKNMFGQENKNGICYLPKLNHDDIELIDTAMSEVAPEPVSILQTKCPGCEKLNTIELDFFDLLSQGTKLLFSEIHTLASFYHWSEAEILAMPRYRRKRYLNFIATSLNQNYQHNNVMKKKSELLTRSVNALS